MLVLRRKPGEKLVIGGNIIITVKEIAHGKVKLGIEAPRDISVNRQEVHDKIMAKMAKKKPQPPQSDQGPILMP